MLSKIKNLAVNSAFTKVLFFSKIFPELINNHHIERTLKIDLKTVVKTKQHATAEIIFHLKLIPFYEQFVPSQKIEEARIPLLPIQSTL